MARPNAASPGARRHLATLARSHPETTPMLGLVGEVLDAAADPIWDAAAAAATLRGDHPTPAPILTGAIVLLPHPAAADLLHRLLVLAAETGGLDAVPLAVAVRAGALDTLVLLEAAVNQDEARVAAIAAGLRLGPEPLGSVVQLATVPLLQACRRRFAPAVSPSWEAGYCPVCGTWPALAEDRGLERTRHLRCARCGADWAAPALRCPYCATADHRRLGSLSPAAGGEARRVETCAACNGYLKVLATLRPWPGDEVGLADLGSVELDLAAHDHGYRRPLTGAVHLGLSLTDPAADGAGKPSRSR
jgi:FdhE protein